MRGVQRHNVHQAATSWRFHIAFPSLGSLIITSCIMPQLNYAILSFKVHFIQCGRNHFCRNVSKRKRMEKKTNKQTSKYARFPFVFPRKTAKIERKKVSWCVVDNCSLPPRCCGIECDQKSAITQCLSEQVVLRVPCWQVPELPVSPIIT